MDERRIGHGRYISAFEWAYYAYVKKLTGRRNEHVHTAPAQFGRCFDKVFMMFVHPNLYRDAFCAGSVKGGFQ